MSALAAAAALGLVLGAVLGGLGGGGAILAVPALVYLMGQTAQEATTSSLVIVGLTAVVGSLSYLAAGRLRWRVGLAFGAAGLPAAWGGSLLNHRLDSDVLLLGFAALMVVAAIAMIADRGGGDVEDPDVDSAPSHDAGPVAGGSGTSTALWERTSQRAAMIPVVAAGLGVGFLTGLFGVGGGFVIVPALVLVVRLPMAQVVGTSLLIVALNSASSLISRATTAHFDWEVIVPFTVAAMVATFVGKRFADRLPARRLKLSFAALMVLVAGYTGWQSSQALMEKPADDTASAHPVAHGTDLSVSCEGAYVHASPR